MPQRSSPSLFLELVASPSASVLATPRLMLGERMLHLGRAPDSDLVLADDTVSWRHASVWCERGEVRVRDRESTNGTWIDDQRVDGEVVLHPGQTLRLGTRASFRLGRSAGVEPARAALWSVEIVETGAALGLPPEGVTLGAGAGVDLALALAEVERLHIRPGLDGAEVSAPDGRRWSLRSGVVVEAGGVHLRLVPGGSAPVRTVGQLRPTDRYRLVVSLDGGSGPAATFEDPERGLVHRVGAENRAVLVWQLATRLLDDRAARVPADRQGWCTDEELAAGLWGREATRIAANNLNVLLHRLRKELEEAGFDTAFLEKERRALRARLVHVRRD